MKPLIISFVLLIHITLSAAQNDYPKPTEKDIIFYIQHNRGKNTFTYQPNYSSKGILDIETPLIAKRQLFDKNGEIKPLTPIQKKYAYGINTSKIGDNTFDVRLVSYPNQKLLLKIDNKNKPYIETTINGKHLILHRLFIYQKDGTSGLKTAVDYILFQGVDKNGKEIQVKFTP